MTAIQAVLNDLTGRDQIRFCACSSCYMCEAEGDSLYRDLKDRYFAASGVWNLKKCRNAACGMVWLDPMPIKEDIGKAYQSYYTHSDLTIGAEDNTSTRGFNQAVKAGYLAHAYGYNCGGARLLGLLAYLVPFRRAALDFTMMYLPYLSGGRLLEVGCGDGTMLKGMADLGWQVEGIDIDPAAVENSRRKGLNVQTRYLEDLQYPQDCFDAITMSHLIEHVHDPLELLRECHRILKPTGRLALVTPNINSAGHRIYGSSWFHLDPPRHLRIFTVDSLTTLLQKAGFHKAKIGTTIRDAGTAYVASRSVQRTGRYEMGSRQPWSARFWGKAMQAIEWAWLKLDRQAGEEIAAIAQK
jgi:2-polyprenyl-3-methyl-5-hydroxy-6-metoxy-1,4-benzoquinol methylase